MTAIDVPDTHADLLSAPLTAVLTTVNPDGQPQSTAVWYLVDEDGALKTSVVTTRQKHRNLRREPKATLFVMDPSNPFRTLEVRATAELVPDPEKAMLAKFATRYGTDVATLDMPGTERVTVVFHPARVVTFG
jgi:PPOX class probable F420-dependent enzyme